MIVGILCTMSYFGCHMKFGNIFKQKTRCGCMSSVSTTKASLVRTKFRWIRSDVFVQKKQVIVQIVFIFFMLFIFFRNQVFYWV